MITHSRTVFQSPCDNNWPLNGLWWAVMWVGLYTCRWNIIKNVLFTLAETILQKIIFYSLYAIKFYFYITCLLNIFLNIDPIQLSSWDANSCSCTKIILSIIWYGRRDPSRWPRGTHYPQKVALTSPTSGGHSVGIVRSWTKATELVS
jgi:hypothetical protein